MKTFKEILNENSSQPDIPRLKLIADYLNQAVSLLSSGEKIDKKSIDKFNKCLQGMAGCAGKIKEIAENAK